MATASEQESRAGEGLPSKHPLGVSFGKTNDCGPQMPPLAGVQLIAHLASQSNEILAPAVLRPAPLQVRAADGLPLMHPAASTANETEVCATHVPPLTPTHSISQPASQLKLMSSPPVLAPAPPHVNGPSASPVSQPSEGSPSVMVFPSSAQTPPLAGLHATVHTAKEGRGS